MTEPRKLLIPVLFLLTGAFALCYEVVWARYLHLFIGHTTQAYTIVLATFMGGQALGYVIFGRYADRAARPLAAYGAIEMAIGVYSVLFPSIYKAVGPAFLARATALGLAPGSGALLAAKLLAGTALILPPAVLMGGTLPLVVRARLALGGVASQTLARLYAINCAGAVIGTLTTAYFLLPSWGTAASVLGTGIVNALVGIVAFLAAGPARPEVSSADASREEELPAARQEAASPRAALAAALLGAAATGFAAMVYEVAWTRLLAIALGASTYAFAIMLATYIGGIAIGARIAGGPRALGQPPLRLFGALQVATGVAIALALPLYELVPNALRTVLQLLSRSPDAFPIFLVAQLVIAASIMLVPAILGGMCLPVATRAVTSAAGAAAVGRAIGRAFSANTAGTLLGAALGGLVILPAVGIRHAFTVGIAVNALAGAAALLASRPAGQGLSLSRAVPLALAPLVILGSLLPGFTRGVLTFQTFRRNDASGIASNADFLEAAEKRAKGILYDEDGAAATVTVFETDTGTEKKRVLLINGKADASTGGDMGVQLLLGHLPLLLKPDAKEVFVIGLGCGMTAGAILKHPVERLDVCEISPEVVRASRLFAKEAGAPLDDPRTHVLEEDARIALALAPRRYDIVISEPSNPWVAGIGALFTEEHFQAVAAHLEDDGIALQWFHLYECSDPLVMLVLRTFKKVFPEMRIFTDRMRSDLLLVGAKRAGVLDARLDALEARMALPGVRADLAREGISDPTTLYWLELFGPEEAARVIGPGPLHRDDRPVLETEGPRALFQGSRAEAVFALAEDAGRLPPKGDLLLQRRLADRPATPSETAALERYLKQSGSAAWQELEALLAIASEERAGHERIVALRGEASFIQQRPGFPDARPLLARIAASPEASADDLVAWIDAESRMDDRRRSRLLPGRSASLYAKAMQGAEALLARYPKEKARALTYLGRLAARRGALDEAAARYQAAIDAEGAPHELRALCLVETARVRFAQARREEARAALEAATALAVQAWRAGSPEGRNVARSIARRVLELDPDSADARTITAP